MLFHFLVVNAMTATLVRNSQNLVFERGEKSFTQGMHALLAGDTKDTFTAYFQSVNDTPGPFQLYRAQGSDLQFAIEEFAVQLSSLVRRRPNMRPWVEALYNDLQAHMVLLQTLFQARVDLDNLEMSNYLAVHPAMILRLFREIRTAFDQKPASPP